MRFGFAITALVLAGVLLLLGIGQNTFLAGPREVVYQVQAGEDTEYSVIPAAELNSVRGQANAVVAGEDGFVAIGSNTDVEAWVEPFAHSVLTTDKEVSQLVEAKSLRAGHPDFIADLSEEDVAALDPSGSDLWLNEQAGSGRLPLKLSTDESLLVSGNGQVSIEWVQDRRTPWAGPLLVAGGLFALLGGVLYLLAVDHNRRGLGPRRGRKGPFQGLRSKLPKLKEKQSKPDMKGTTVKRVALPALGLVVALGLSSCSANYWPNMAPSSNETSTAEEPGSGIAPAPITQPQIDRIIDDIVEVAGTGDQELDAQVLEQRFAGDALAQRAANYKIRKSVPKYEVVLPTITTEQLGYELVQSTEGWPRTVFVTLASQAPDAEEAEKADDEDTATELPAASPSLALVMKQTSPLENYQVTRLFALRGGITMPEAAPAEEGTALLAPDLESLALMPQEVGNVYAKILAGDKDSEQAALFDLEDDSIVEKSGVAWVAAANAAAKADSNDVKYSVAVAQSEAPILSLSTGVGGALVSTTVHETRTEAQSEDYQPKAVGAVTALSGLKGAQKRIVSTVSHQLLFFVPSSTSGDPIQLLGYTTELVGAKK